MSNDELPEGWICTTLGEGLVVDVQPGFACGSHNRQGDGIPHLRPMNVSEEGRIVLSNLKYVPKDRADREERQIRAGDVLFNNTNSPALVGKTAYYADTVPRAFSNHMTRVRCRLDAIDPLFCAIALHQKWREGYFESICNNHVSQASVSRFVLLSTSILLPPLAEQKRIVAKVEELLARVNAARERLARVPAILKRFRQAVLSAACSGRLTADWRERQGVLEPSGSELPCSWRRRELADLCSAFEYGSSRKSNKKGSVPVLRMGNIQDGRIDWSDLVYSDDEEEVEKYRLVPNTVLFNRTNSPELVGKTGLYRGERPAIFAGYLIRVLTDTELDPAFLNLSLNAPAFRDYCQQVKTDGVSQSNINARKLASYSINWCSLSEQHEIVRRVEALFNLAGAIEKRVAAATERADKLTQAILAKAFRGELVPTEAELARIEGRDYEPASALLERIRREQDSAPKRITVKRTRR
jgi:type I restriction enzyme, S subunit